MCGESLLQDALLPLMKRHLIQAGCNMVPERLYVVDLIFDRKIVESRRWQWHRVSHHRDYTTASELAVGSGWRLSSEHAIGPFPTRSGLTRAITAPTLVRPPSGFED